MGARDLLACSGNAGEAKENARSDEYLSQKALSSKNTNTRRRPKHSSLRWWQQQQLPLLASVERSGVVLILGGADGSAAPRCSVLLPLLLLQHEWAPQQSLQQQHIIVALETSAAVDSAAAAARAWGANCYASCIHTTKGSTRSRTPPRVIYLTTRQLFQRLLQQPLLPGCCIAALEVSLLHGFSTELLLPLLRKVRQRRPTLRLLLLLPPASIQPQWALQLGEFFADTKDAAAPEAAAVSPRGALEVLRAAVLRQQQLLMRLLQPKSKRWDVKVAQRSATREDEQAQRQRSSSVSEVQETAAPSEVPEVPDPIELLGISEGQERSASGGPSKRKKVKTKEKRRLQQRLRKPGAPSEAVSLAYGAESSVSMIGFSPPTHRVAVRYLKKATPNFVRAAASLVALATCAAVSSLVASAAGAPGGLASSGSIFVFLPSPEDVTSLTEALQRNLQYMLRKQQPEHHQPVEIVCLAQDLDPRLPPPSSSLRIFLSSAAFPPSVSPSSLSVEFVVDCMYIRRLVFDSFLNLKRSANVPITRALADLRASLAGRVSHADACGELDASAFEDIAPLLLQLKALGLHALQRLPQLQPPPTAVVVDAVERLFKLQAIDDAQRITKPLGRMMARGILSPELTRLLVISADPAFGCSQEASAICALLSGPPVWRRSALEDCGSSLGDSSKEGRRTVSAARQRLALCRALLGAIEGDPLTALNVFGQYFDVKKTNGDAAAARWAEKYLVDEQVMRRAANMQHMLLQWLQFPTSASTPPFVIHPSSVLANCGHPFVVYGQAFMRDGCVYMQQVTAIEPEWLPQVAGHLFAVPL
ncbi:helicase associated domain-containing protein [Cyclospora cayetanensis]|uniref:Helicase associated domain-containing protein n=1 Tax=Cyclospora cayetanensis TaxID=88456 RepID=A0A1D3D3W0_9EIME|nr:helicase associated domain-containing protein [Cyclospora cayetanensis]